MRWSFTPSIALVLVACVDNPIRDCDGIKQQVVWMEKGLLKITGARETSRSSTELVCHGTAIYKDDSKIEMRYRVYIDEDGEEMIVYDTDEVDAEREAAEERKAEQEIETVVEDAMQDLDQYMQDNMPSSTWGRMQQQAGETEY